MSVFSAIPAIYLYVKLSLFKVVRVYWFNLGKHLYPNDWKIGSITKEVGNVGEKRRKYVSFFKKTLHFISWNGCSNKVDKPLILLAKEDFLFTILVLEARTQLQYQKTINRTLSSPKNDLSPWHRTSLILFVECHFYWR